MSVLDTTAWEKFAQKAYAVDKACMPIFTAAIKSMAEVTAGELREYPESTAANQPGRISPITGRPLGYYERHRGWWYPVMRERTLAGLNKKTLGVMKSKVTHLPVAGYKLAKNKKAGKRGTSELMGMKWVTEVTQNEQAGFVEAVIGNTASYEQYVQGDRQSRKMAAIGWRSAEQAAEKLTPQYEEIMAQAVDDIVKYFGGTFT